jgi:outer membrane receptor protein involved in Fe transport
MLLTYTARRWGGELAGTFVGRRPDSDFSGLLPPVTYAAGYGRIDLGGWFALNPRVTAYVNVGNALNRKYDEAAGYPALHANFRAGMRFRVGGE